MPEPVSKNRAVKILFFCVNLLLMGVAILVMRLSDQKKLLQAESDKISPPENIPEAENSFSNQIPEENRQSENSIPDDPIESVNISETTLEPLAPTVSNPVPAPAPTPAVSAPKKAAPSNAKTKTS